MKEEKKDLIKPLKNRTKFLKTRFLLLIFLMISSLMVAYFYQKNKQKFNVLGGETKRGNGIKEKNDFGQSPDVFIKTAKNISKKTIDSISKKTGEYIQEVVDQSKEKVSDLVIDSAVGGVMNQVDKLPEKQKEEIRRQICQ